MREENRGVWSGLVSLGLQIKTVLMVLSMAALLATNIATVLSAGVYDVLHAGLRTALLVLGKDVADEAMARSKVAQFERQNRELRQRVETAEADLGKEKTLRSKAAADLKMEQDAHAKSRATLDEERVHSKRVAAELDEVKVKSTKHAKSAKEVAGSVKKRLAKGFARNTASLPAEALPYIGIGVALSMTALDLYDACETMKEINGLLKLLGQGEEDPDFCGTKLPTKEEVAKNLKTTWSESHARAREEAAKVQTDVPAPQVRLPTLLEVKSAVCPLISIPGC